MPLDQKLALLAVFLQVVLTFYAVAKTGLTRVRSIKDKRIRLADISLASTHYPDAVRQQGNNLNNQFEFPILLYVVVILALILNGMTLPFALACLGFSISRIVHRIIHVSSNNVQSRFIAFLVGIILLAAAWVMLAVKVLIIL